MRYRLASASILDRFWNELPGTRSGWMKPSASIMRPYAQPGAMRWPARKSHGGSGEYVADNRRFLAQESKLARRAGLRAFGGEAAPALRSAR